MIGCHKKIDLQISRQLNSDTCFVPPWWSTSLFQKKWKGLQGTECFRSLSWSDTRTECYSSSILQQFCSLQQHWQNLNNWNKTILTRLEATNQWIAIVRKKATNEFYENTPSKLDCLAKAHGTDSLVWASILLHTISCDNKTTKHLLLVFKHWMIIFC